MKGIGGEFSRLLSKKRKEGGKFSVRWHKDKEVAGKRKLGYGN